MEIHRIQQEFGYCTIPDNDDDEPALPYRPALLQRPKELGVIRAT